MMNMMNYGMPPNMAMMPQNFGMGNKGPGAPPLYIGDLDDTIREEYLYDFFSRFGPLHFVRVMNDATTKKSRGFAYVNFAYPKDAENARINAQYEKIGRKNIRIMFKRDVNNLPRDANVFVKNLDTNVNVKDLHNFFNQVKPVVCAKVGTNNEGQSLGYGYVQFENREDAETALRSLQGAKLKENELQLYTFESKDNRGSENSKKNLFVKNFPAEKTTEELETFLRETFEKYGQIETMLVKEKPGENKKYAFVCFTDEHSALDAISGLSANPKQLEGSDKPLHVAWYQDRQERSSELQKMYGPHKNQNTLYVKNLKLDATEDEVKDAFQRFGNITSVACKDRIVDGEKKGRYGFIAFDSVEDAQKAQNEALKVPEVLELYLENPYVNLLQSKEQRKEYLDSYGRRKMHSSGGFGQEQFGGMQYPYYNGRFPQFPQQQMMMMMGQQPMFMPQGGPRNQRGGGHFQRGGHRGGFNQRGGYNQRGGGQQRYQGYRNNDYQNQQGQGQHQQNQNYHQNNNYNQGQGNRQNNRPNTSQQAGAQPTSQLQSNQGSITVQSLRSRLSEFLALDQNKQRQILGELLFPLIKPHAGDLAPKVTGMLIDLSVLEISEILEFLENPTILKERIEEAKEVIIEGNL